MADERLEVRARSSHALELMHEVIDDATFVDVVKLQPPDGMVIRDIAGIMYGVSIYRLEGK